MTKDGLIKLKEEFDKYMKRQKEISDTEAKISEMNTDVFVRNKSVRHLIEMNKELEQEIAELQEKHESYTKEDDTISILENEIERLGIERKELYEQRDIYQFSSVLLKDSGIKSRIIKQYIPVINKLINKYLAEMEFVVHFELDESFNETIKSRFRDVFSYSSFSEGEKMRINLAILFTWRAIAKIRNSASTNLLILDEIFDGSLDAAGTEEFMKILNSLIGNSNTFIISHKTEQLQDKFENVIKFEKYKNFSRMAA
jgi:DNA repair exonuclease SbcCD ATPase subunit